jgi:hypothetical protein
MNYSISFWRFRDLLKQSNFDTRGLVRKEIKIHPTGWTEESLLSLFDESDPIVPVYMVGCIYCQKRFRSFPNVFSEEVPWERKLQRLKDGIDMNEPLTEEEQQRQDEWDRQLQTIEYVCTDCVRIHRRETPFDEDDDKYEAKPWAPNLERKEDWDDWWSMDYW